MCGRLSTGNRCMKYGGDCTVHHVMGSNNLNSLSVARTYKLRPFGPII